MPGGRRTRAKGLVDLRNPLTDHDLNQGRVFWQLALPGRFGGPVTWDLVQGLSSPLNSTGVSWQNLSNPGGSGSLSFAGGGSDYVVVPSSLIGALPSSPAPQVTVACWFRPTSSLTAYQTLFDASPLLGAGSRQLSAFLGGSANHIFIAIANTSGAEPILAVSWVLNEWNFLAITTAGTNATTNVYQGVAGGPLGVFNCASVTGFAVGSGFIAAPWYIGNVISTGGTPFVGQQNDISVWNRVLSANEVASVYQLSQQGYPGVLRRRQRVAYSSPPPVSLPNTVWLLKG